MYLGLNVNEEQLWLPLDYTQPDYKPKYFGNCCSRENIADESRERTLTNGRIELQ